MSKGPVTIMSLEEWAKRPRSIVYPCHMATGDKIVIDGKERVATCDTLISNRQEAVAFVEGEKDHG